MGVTCKPSSLAASSQTVTRGSEKLAPSGTKRISPSAPALKWSYARTLSHVAKHRETKSCRDDSGRPFLHPRRTTCPSVRAHTGAENDDAGRDFHRWSRNRGGRPDGAAAGSALNRHSVFGDGRPANPAIGTDVHSRSTDETALDTHIGLHRHVLIALDAAQDSRARTNVQPASGHDVCGDDVPAWISKSSSIKRRPTGRRGSTVSAATSVAPAFKCPSAMRGAFRRWKAQPNSN